MKCRILFKIPISALIPRARFITESFLGPYEGYRIRNATTIVSIENFDHESDSLC